MTSLTILPNTDKKTLKLTGKVAAGEHVAVSVSGGADWIGVGKALRLRVLFGMKQVAMFPLVTEEDAAADTSGETVADAWAAGGEGDADATCTLNLFTIPAEKYLKFGGNCLWVLDDIENNTLYGTGEMEVLPWPKRRGSDVPYALDEYPDIVAELGERIDAAEVSISGAVDEANGIVAYVTAAKSDAESSAHTARVARNQAQTAQGKAEDAQAAAEAAQAAAEAALPLDATLATEGKAADAKAVGDAIALKADKSTTYTKFDTYTKTETINAISTAIATVVDSAPEAFDTLKEIADWIEDDVSGAAAMAAAIKGKVDKVSGKGLSANDYTDAEKSKLAGIAAGAQVNPTPIAPAIATESGMFADAYWTKQDLAGKADKVAYAVEGNLAALDSNGNLADSGMALRDFAVAKSLAPAFVAGDAYEVGDLCTSFDNDEQHRGTWLYKCILATDGSQPTWPEADPTHWALATVEDLLAALRTAVANVGTPIAPSQDSADEGKAADAYATGMALSAKAEARSGTQGNIAVYAEYSTLLEDSGYAPSDFAPADALNGKANKVANAISGNLAGFDSSGDLTDSGCAPSYFATPADIPSASSTSPSMDGTAAVGVSDDYARSDHVHPSDTSKADVSALRYAMPESVALTPSGDAATLVCADRAVTNATIATGFSTLNLTFPAEASGYVRDFYLRITVAAGQSAPSISVPQGVTLENAGGAVPEIADGEASAAATTLVWFSETAPGVFTAKSETVKAVV